MYVFSPYGILEYPAYPAKDYEAETLATKLFLHYCTYGTFDEIAMDPGSANCSEVVQRLNELLGVKAKISLVGRHESNGCEGVRIVEITSILIYTCFRLIY